MVSEGKGLSPVTVRLGAWAAVGEAVMEQVCEDQRVKEEDAQK